MHVYVLVMLVVADGRWLDWNHYARREECEEILRTLTHHRDTVLQGRCELRWVEKAPAQ
jgi:hypothetical protein